MVNWNENKNKACKDDLVDVWLGEELFAEAGVAPQPQDERDAHDEEDADDDEGEHEGRVSFLGSNFCFSIPINGSIFLHSCIYQNWWSFSWKVALRINTSYINYYSRATYPKPFHLHTLSSAPPLESLENYFVLK